MQGIILVRCLLRDFLDAHAQTTLPQKHCDGDDRRG